MKLPKNLLSGTHEPPEFYLCQVDKSIIGGLNVIEPTGVFKFNAYSEITFQVDRLYQHPTTGDIVVNPVYDYVEALRLLYIVDFGYFQIQEAAIVSDGIREYKDVVAYSLEYEMTQKYLDTFIINHDTEENGSINGVTLYNTSDISHSLIHLVLDKMNYGFYNLSPQEQQELQGKQWIVGHVDESLQNLSRSFEVDHEAIYDFLMNDMAEAFQMVVVFDTYDRTVNLYAEESAGSETNITVAMDTIANEVKIDYSADDIKTCLYAYGADDLTIREVNVGLGYITNIDYYNTPEWLGEDLHNAYNEYTEFIEVKRAEYSELIQEWSRIYDQISELENKVPHYEEDDIPSVTSYTDLPQASEENVYKIYKVINDDGTKYYICKASESDGNTTYSWVLDVDGITSFYTLPEASEKYVGGVYKVYNEGNTNGVLYYVCEVKEGPTQENDYTTKYHWVLAENQYGIYLLKEKEDVYLTIQEVQVSAGFASAALDSTEYRLYSENKKKLKDIQKLLKEANALKSELEADLSDVTAEMAEITQEIDLENHFTPEQIVILNSFMREDEYTNDNILVTKYNDDETIMDVKQDLLEAAQKELAKLSQPQLSFSMSMANILAIPEFEPVINDFECGNYVMVEIRPDYVVKTQILEVNINFDDLSDFSVVFGNLASLYSQTDIHAALMSQAISAGKSVAENGSYWDSGANKANSIISRIESGLIDANTTIKSTENQAISWDSHGIHLRKYADESKSEYLDEQIWLNNEKIVFTDDNWDTAKMAIGKFTDMNVGETYGIIAPSVVGTLLAGQNLVIDSQTKDGETLSSFRVDENGARLYNSPFIMEKEVQYVDENQQTKTTMGQIMIDPDYGIIAGHDVYKIDSNGTYTPQFVDKNDNIIVDQHLMPLNSNFFLDIDSGSAYFRGTVYAENGFFEGEVNATSGEIGGCKIIDNKLTIENINIAGGSIKFDQFDDDLQIKIDGKSTIYTERPASQRVGDLLVPSEEIVITPKREFVKDKIYKCTTTSDAFSSDSWVEITQENDESLYNYLKKYYTDGVLEDLNNQDDKKADIWYDTHFTGFEYSTNEEMKLHDKDIYFNSMIAPPAGSSGRNQIDYMLILSEDKYGGIQLGKSTISDTPPDNIYDTTDGHSSLYVYKPNNQEENDYIMPYETFVAGCVFTKNKVYRCTGTSDTFNPDLWIEVDYTDDTKANEAYSLADTAKQVGDKLVNTLGIDTTVITDKYVISPYIGGGYLDIANETSGARVTIDPYNLTNNGYIFQVNNGQKVTVGVDKDGNSVFSGSISGGSLLIGDKTTLDENGKIKNPYAEITSDGILNCNGANITGAINATSGTIGKCTINSEGELIVPAAHITDLTLDALGSISFGDLSDAVDVQNDIDSKLSESDLQAFANGSTEGITGTFINGTSITSPKIYGGEFYGDEFNVISGDSGGAFNLYGKAGNDVYHLFTITHTWENVNIYSPASALINISGVIDFNGSVDFAGATVTGLTVSGATAVFG